MAQMNETGNEEGQNLQVRDLMNQLEQLKKLQGELFKTENSFIWNAWLPTKHYHTVNDVERGYYHTWGHHEGNLVDGTFKANPRFNLVHGDMAVCLLRSHKLHNVQGKYYYRQAIGLNLNQNESRLQRDLVRFKYCVKSLDDDVLLSKEKTALLQPGQEYQMEEFFPAGLDLPPDVKIHVTLLEWREAGNMQGSESWKPFVALSETEATLSSEINNPLYDGFRKRCRRGMGDGGGDGGCDGGGGD